MRMRQTPISKSEHMNIVSKVKIDRFLLIVILILIKKYFFFGVNN